MAEHSSIEWTDATWNPITGCSVVSPGCTNCYAMKLAGTRLKHHASRAGLTTDSKAGPVWNGQVRLNAQWLDQPLRWKKPSMIFVCAHGDLFHERVPDEWIDQVFAIMALSPRHTFQVLTKRSARMRDYLSTRAGDWQLHWPDAARKAGALLGDIATVKRVTLPLPNVWLGVSAEDQRRADERIPDLLATPAAIRYLSAEPLLGPIDLTMIPTGGRIGDSILCGDALRGPPDMQSGGSLDQVIVGGESGQGARPMHPDWARSLRGQCAAAGVPFFFKQWGSWGPGANFAADTSARKAYLGEVQTLQIAGSREVRLCIPTRFDDELGPPLTLENYGKKAAGRLLDGIEHNGMPQPREVPAL